MLPPELPLSMRRLRVGVLGAGRTRQGLGPFLARAFEAAGCTVAAVAGRERASAERAAAALARQLGHAVVVAGDALALARDVDALVVAAPVPGHLAGLDAALAAGVPCLCEKPFVAATERDAGLARAAAFVARGLVLHENCQWPFVLPVLFALHPELAGQRVREVVMRLSPAWPGRTMVEDSLSHVLSLVQALVDVPAGAVPGDVRQTNGAADAENNDVSFTVPAATGPVAVTLHLVRCEQQPRPAWFAVNGCRIDRRLGADYAISFAAADGRVHPVRDPLDQLVDAFVAAVRAPSAAAVARHADAIATRLSLYAGVLRALGDGG